MQARQALWLGHLFTSWERATQTLKHVQNIKARLALKLGDNVTITSTQPEGVSC
jgi:hypothetical protein